MAINLDDRYPGRANPKSASYPQGSFKNRTAPNSNDGTYLEQDWANDQLAFFQSLMSEAGIMANGAVDIVGASQYFSALIQTIKSTSLPIHATRPLTNVGPVIYVLDVRSVMHWVSTAYYTGYRTRDAGEFAFSAHAVTPPWMVEAEGNTLNETDHGGLIAAFREKGLTVAAGNWVKGEYKIAGLGGGNWKAPDMRDQFLRATGTDADTANATVRAAYKADSFKQHQHTAPGVRVTSRSVGSDWTSPTDDSSTGLVNSTVFLSGATGAAETAPRHTYFAPVMFL